MGIIRRALLSLLALSLGSCVDFHGQTLTYRYDRASDTLRLFLVYEAIHVAGEAGAGQAEGPLTPREKEQLESVVRGRRVFFFDNWLSEFNAEGIEKELRDRRERLQHADAERPERLKADVDFLEALLKAVSVRNGRFYLNGRGELCGWQYVTVSGVTKLLPLLNAWSGRQARDVNAEGLGERARQRLRDVVAKEEWVRVDGNQIRIRAVLPYEKFAATRKEMAETSRPLDFRSGDVVLNYDEPIVEIILGRLDQETTTLSRPVGDRPSGALVDYVKKKYGLAPPPDLDALRDAFIRTGKVPD